MKTLKLAAISVKSALAKAGLSLGSYTGYYWLRGFEVKAHKTDKSTDHVRVEWHAHHRYVQSDEGTKADAAELARYHYLAVQKLTEAGYRAEVVNAAHEWYTDNYVRVTLP